MVPCFVWERNTHTHKHVFNAVVLLSRSGVRVGLLRPGAFIANDDVLRSDTACADFCIPFGNTLKRYLLRPGTMVQPALNLSAQMMFWSAQQGPENVQV